MEINGDSVTVKPDKKAREWEDTIDDMLLLETTDQASPAEDIVKRYKELAEIKRGWRALKGTIYMRLLRIIGNIHIILENFFGSIQSRMTNKFGIIFSR